MKKNLKEAITDPSILKLSSYKDPLQIEKRGAIYEYTYPHYIIEDEVIDLLGLIGDKSLLDVGCGGGRMLLKAAERYPDAKLVGVDISPGMYAFAEEVARKEGMHITFQESDIMNLPYDDNSFDRVSCMHMLYHVPDIERAVAELSRVVSSNGVVVITANSIKSKPALRMLKQEAAKLMNVDEIPEMDIRFNVDDGHSVLSSQFQHLERKLYISTLRLTETRPYVDYFDSTKHFWSNKPTDVQWSDVLDMVRFYIQEEIDRAGSFEEQNIFGAYILRK